MKVFVRILVLLLVYLLTTLSAFGIITYLYDVAILSNIMHQLYIGIGAGVAALAFGLLLVLVKNQEQTLIFEEDGDENVDFETRPVTNKAEVKNTPVEEVVIKDPVITDSLEETKSETIKIVDVHREPEVGFVDDTTMVIEKVSEDINEESFEEITEEWEEEPATEEFAQSIPKVELVSPFGSSNITEEVNEQNVSEDTTEEDYVDDIALEVVEEVLSAEVENEVEELNVEPVNVDVETPEPQLAEVKEPEFRSSTYIDENGRPQFRITDEYKTSDFHDDYEDIKFADYDTDVSKENRFRDILGRIGSALLVIAAAAVLYFLYVKMVG